MPMQTTRRTMAVVVAAGALLLAALAVAPTANAATLYACVKKNGTAHIYGKKPKCRKHETKLSWNTEGLGGKNGLNGLNGANGKNGANGTNGTNGKEGPPGPFGETLPSGKSETGAYSLEGDGSVVQSGYGFPVALASAPAAHLIQDGGTPPAECPGTLSNPKASPGNLCVYEGTSHGGSITSRGIFNPENEKFGSASRFGFGFDLNNSTTGNNVWSMGTWAVTAP
jgi:hypothetical protein